MIVRPRRFIAPAMVFLFAVTVLVSCTSAPTSDSPEARRSAAIRYHEVLPMESMMDELVSQLVLQAPPEARAEAKRMMLEGIDFNRLREISTELMVKHFAAGEITALTDFYASAEGRAVMQKMPSYTAELMPLIQREILGAMPRQ